MEQRFQCFVPIPSQQFFFLRQRKFYPYEVSSMIGECTQTERAAFYDSMRSMGMGGSWLEAGEREFPRQQVMLRNCRE